MWTRLDFELFPARSLHVLLVRGAPGLAAPLRALIAARALDVALLDAALLPGLGALSLAANRALYGAEVLGKLRAASLHAELLASLGATRNVGEALRALGPGDDCAAVLVGVFDGIDEALRRRVEGLLEGERCDPSAFYPAGADGARIRTLYRVAPAEGAGGLAAAVTGRIAMQDLGGGGGSSGP
jgi:tRNA threonylcarbamoyladenosine modification (KEOPS) complex Cgi121 subunit